jgi:uncharacterized protein (TIGR03663 family)
MKRMAQDTGVTDETIPLPEAAPPAVAQEEPSLLRRPLVWVNGEIAAYVVLVVLSVVAHLWGLGAMAMHHDESIHAWSSWKFYTGDGGFSCYDPNPNDDIPSTSTTYCYDPIYHGPSLYILTLLSFFLFGDGDAQARLPMALAGIGLVASCWMLRPLIGKRGAFIAAVLLGFSPSLLYFTRFARHDGLMVLWELWMVVGVFRYLQSGRAGYLYLLAVSLALAVGTHELYYILFFIFGIFLLLRLLAESPYARYMNIVLPSLLGLCVVLMVLNPPLPIGQGLYLGEKALLVASALLVGWLCHRVWPREQIVIPRFVDLWRNQRTTLWLALGVLVTLYVVQYTTFFSHFRGALDGLYAGIAYWLGSQHEYARGDQPWYYYLMQLPLYEILGVVCGIGAAIYLFTRHATQFVVDGATGEPASGQTVPADVALSAEAEKVAAGSDGAATPERDGQETTAAVDGDGTEATAAADGDGAEEVATAAPVARAPLSPERLAAVLFPLLLVFWYFNAIVIFSWAGEKMPWLLVHMALPGNVLAAWALGRLLSTVDTAPAESAPGGRGGLLLIVPPAVLVMLIAFLVFLWRYYSAGEGQEGQASLVQSLVPLIIAGAIFFGLLTLGNRIGMRVLLSLTALTFATVLGAYMLRATWLAVYEHPDTPVELLVYTQTSPDVPRYVRDIEELSINLTRLERSDDDITGGLSMPIIVDSGDEQGEGSLAWPLQWYFRNFQEVNWKKYESFSNPTADTFQVTLPNGETTLAPVVMLYKPHVNDNVRDVLSENYVQPYGDGGALNWWFPEGNKCSPGEPGYKKYYFNSWMAQSPRGRKKLADCGDDIAERLHAPWAPLLWPLQGHNWDTLKNFVLYRELPSALRPGSRSMEVWVRNDLMSGASEVEGAAGSDTPFVHLLAQQALGEQDAMLQPTGLTVDADGKVYVADTLNHRILVYNANGELEQRIGSMGNGEGQFMEPRGVAVDEDGFIYVADTWNARIVKLNADGEWVTSWGTWDTDMGSGRRAFMTGGTQEANQANPLGFFGPRGIAVGQDGEIFVTDTGNKRVVVTDSDGEYLYQWGYAGSEPGRFNEPTGIGIDAAGNVYVADTWNGRVQVFSRGPDGDVSPAQVVTWRVRGWHADTYLDPSLAVSRDGHVYVSVPGHNRVLAATMRGDVLLSWGGPGSDIAALNSPSGLAVGPNGHVYVVDRSQDRVLRFVLPSVRPAGTEGEGAGE